jgi:hypothetical protein
MRSSSIMYAAAALPLLSCVCRVSLLRSVFVFVFVCVAQFARGSLSDMSARYDTYYGRPSAQMKVDFQQSVRQILAMDSWPAFFSLLRVPMPSPRGFTVTLHDAIKASLRKGYHNKFTNFTRVHSSGVSKILLKGESYTANPGLKSVEFHDR